MQAGLITQCLTFRDIFVGTPTPFQGKWVNVEVETESEFTIGETTEADGFYDLLTERLSEFG